MFYESLKAGLETFNIPKPQINEILNKMELIIECAHDINSQFDFIANGSYKEVYKLTDNLVIKFCSCSNKTEDEAYILNKASEANLDNIFVRTIFIPLDEGMTQPYLYELEPEYFDDEEPQYETANYIEVQELIDLTVSQDEEEYRYYDSKEEYEEESWLASQSVSYNTYIRTPFCNWLESFLKIYGLEKIQEFASFAEEYGLRDLHSDNLGYVNKNGIFIPIIIDWMSN